MGSRRKPYAVGEHVGGVEILEVVRLHPTQIKHAVYRGKMLCCGTIGDRKHSFIDDRERRGCFSCRDCRGQGMVEKGHARHAWTVGAVINHVEILSLQPEGYRKNTAAAVVRFQCCGAIATLSLAQIRARGRKGMTKCRDCTPREERVSIVGEPLKAFSEPPAWGRPPSVPTGGWRLVR